MNGPQPVPVGALVTHARHVPARERLRFADTAREALSGRAFFLETCHRVEVYTSNAADIESLERSLPAGGRTLIGERAVHHAMTVAVGGDSVVVGEDQILHQLRTAVDEMRAGGHLDAVLERLFALALHAGRRARSWRQGPTRSLADVALASIERRVGPIRGRSILVIGAGTMGRVAVRAAIAAGASVAVANRSTAAAESLAASTGARTEDFDPGDRISGYDGILIAISGPWPIRGETIRACPVDSIAVVDLSVPPAAPAGLAEVLGDRLLTADALAAGDADRAAARGTLPRVGALADRMTAEYVAWLARHEGRAAAEALVERADVERRAELDALWRRLPELEPDARRAIEEMTRHLAGRLLREPLERLGRDADGHDERAVRELFAL